MADVADIEIWTSARLRGRRLAVAHLDDLGAMWLDERVTATLGGPRGRSQVQAILDASDAHWAQHGFGDWSLFDAATDDFVGRAALRHVDIDGAPEVEVGYAIVLHHWGKGLALEATNQLVRIAFEDVGLDDVVAFTLPTNEASERVMQKAGFTYEKQVTWAGLDHVFYRRRSTGGEPTERI